MFVFKATHFSKVTLGWAWHGRF